MCSPNRDKKVYAQTLQRNLIPDLRAVGSAADVVSRWEIVASLLHFVFPPKSCEIANVQKM